MKRFLLSIIYLYLAGMLVAQTAPLEREFGIRIA